MSDYWGRENDMRNYWRGLANIDRSILTRARETCSRLLDSTSAAKHLKKSRFQLHPKLLPCFPIVVVVFCASARTTFTEPRRLAQRPRSSNALAPVISRHEEYTHRALCARRLNLSGARSGRRED